MLPPNNGELTFSLSERTDRNGEKYLFAGVQLLGVVVFVRSDGTDARGVKRYRATVKKYTAPDNSHQDSDIWSEGDK